MSRYRAPSKHEFHVTVFLPLRFRIPSELISRYRALIIAFAGTLDTREREVHFGYARNRIVENTIARNIFPGAPKPK